MRRQAPFLSLLLLSAPLVSPSTARGQELEIVRICASMANESSRLACFDRLTSSLGVSTAGPEGTLWRVEFSADPLTDARTARATLPALQGVGVGGDPILLVLECRGGQTDLFIDWGHYLPNQQEATLRLDTQEPQRTFWEPERNGTRARYRSSAQGLARALSQSRRLVARITPPRQDPITAVFDLTGIDDAVRPVGEACGW